METVNSEKLRTIRFKIVCEGTPTDYYFEDLDTGERFILEGLQLIKFIAGVDDIVPVVELHVADTPLYIIGSPDPVGQIRPTFIKDND